MGWVLCAAFPQVILGEEGKGEFYVLRAVVLDVFRGVGQLESRFPKNLFQGPHFKAGLDKQGHGFEQVVFCLFERNALGDDAKPRA